MIHADYFSLFNLGLLFPDSQNLIGICLNFKEDFRDVFFLPGSKVRMMTNKAHMLMQDSRLIQPS